MQQVSTSHEAREGSAERLPKRSSWNERITGRSENSCPFFFGRVLTASITPLVDAFAIGVGRSFRWQDFDSYLPGRKRLPPSCDPVPNGLSVVDQASRLQRAAETAAPHLRARCSVHTRSCSAYVYGRIVCCRVLCHLAVLSSQFDVRRNDSVRLPTAA